MTKQEMLDLMASNYLEEDLIEGPINTPDGVMLAIPATRKRKSKSKAKLGSKLAQDKLLAVELEAEVNNFIRMAEQMIEEVISMPDVKVEGENYEPDTQLVLKTIHSNRDKILNKVEKLHKKVRSKERMIKKLKNL